MGTVASRDAAASELFPCRTGHGHDIHFLGIDHLVGDPCGWRGPVRRLACWMDLRNSP